MNDLDREIRRAFHELVAAAPPPPVTPGLVAPRRADEHLNGRRMFAVAASVVLIVAIGIGVLAQLDSGTETIAPIDGTRPSTATTSPGPAPSTTPSASTTPATSPTTSAETTSPPTPASTNSPVSPTTDDYVVVAGPTMPEITEPPPSVGQQYDGIYFAYLHEGPLPEDPLRLRFDVLQAFSGAACADRFGPDAASICTPIGTDLTGPVAQIELKVTEVPVSVRSLGSETNHRISGAELIALVNGATPGPGAPEGFAFSGGFGFLLTFDGGTLTRLDQPAAPASGPPSQP